MAKITNRYTYDNLSRLTQTSYGNGVSTEYGYNEGSLLTSLTNRAPGGSVLRQYGYTYLLDGNRAAETEGSKLREYAYDKAGQLTQERLTENGAEKLKYVYGYDSAGNRQLRMKHENGSYTDYILYINNIANQLQKSFSIENSYHHQGCMYDANGNLTQRFNYGDGNRTEAFTYDVLGRQTGYTDGTVTAAYSYDADGLRTSKTVNGVTTEYVTDGGRVVLELVNGTPTARYLYGLGLVHATIGADKYYYSYNGHGDVVQLTDASGNVVRSYEYDAFGNELNPTAGDNNPFRYCGEYFDTETGSYYLRARYYNPQSGRFLTEDRHWNTGNMIYGDAPIQTGGKASIPNIAAIRQSSNLYVYCTSNPVMWRDPSGRNYVAAFENERRIWIPIGGGSDSLWLLEAGLALMLAILGLEPAVNYSTEAIGSLSKGKSNPHDLEKGMSKRQKEMFQREIESYKKESGIPPNGNLPWEILVILAEEIRQMYK